VGAVGHDLGAEEDAAEGAVAAHQAADVDDHRLTAGLADHRDAAAIGERLDRALQGRAADAVDDEVHALLVGDLHHRLRHRVLGVVDAVVEAVGLQLLQPRVAGGGGEYRRARPLGQLDGGQAHAGGARLDQHRLAGLEAAELEQAVVRRSEGHRDDRGVARVEAVRDRPAIAGRHRPQFGVAAEAVAGGDLLADLQMGDLGADLDDFAGRLVADDVRHAHQRPAPAVQRVAALDGDGQHPDDDALGVADGIGDVLVLQDVGGSVLVVDGGFHGGLSGDMYRRYVSPNPVSVMARLGDTYLAVHVPPTPRPAACGRSRGFPSPAGRRGGTASPRRRTGR
jgi:hypothetical protein